MAFQVETTRYEFAHGRKPRGKGMWAFDFVFPNGTEVTVFAPREMTYASAKEWARFYTTDKPVRRVYVAS